MKKIYQVAFLAFGTVLFNSSCKKVSPESSSVDNNNKLMSISAFLPKGAVTVKSGYLSFSSYQSLDSFIADVNLADPKSVNLWESSNGFESHRRIFTEVVNAEDSIDNLFETKVLTGSQVFSTQLNRAITLGVIGYKTDYDATQYWTLLSRFDYLKAALNVDGLIEIDNKLHKYYNDGTIKIAKSSGFSPSSFDAISATNELVDVIVTPAENPTFETMIDRGVSTPGECISVYPNAAFDSYTKTNAWQSPENRRRVKLELHWYSAKNFGQQDCQRFIGIEVKFFLRSYAQKKNFWGNWVFSNYTAHLTYKVNSRNYNFSTNMSCLYPEIYRTNYLPVLNSATLPGQTWSGWTNNGTLTLNPHISGWYVFSTGATTERFKCPAFLNNFSITANYAGKTNWGLE